MSSIAALPRWTLAGLVGAPDSPGVDGYLQQLDRALGQIEALQPPPSSEITEDAFRGLLHLYEDITAISRRLGAYSYLWFAEDTQNQAALNLQGRLDQALAGAQNRLLPFELWFKGLPEETARRLIAAGGDASYFLETLRRFQPFTLSEAAEKAITLKDTNGISGLVTIYQMITNRFSFTLQAEGQTLNLTRDGLSPYIRHAAPEVRVAAYRELYRVYQENKAVLAQIYSYRVRDWRAEMIEMRGFGEPIAARNLLNDLPDAVVDALLSACRANAGLFQRYFRLKARLLGVERLQRYDLYAPLGAAEKTYNLPQAIELVMGSLRPFSPALAAAAMQVLDTGQLDAQVRPGKRGGAFCYPVLPGLTPWVLTNYAGTALDVSTLAHELGHAAHALLAAEHSVLTFDACLPLAETASVFGELLLTRHLLQQETDPAVRRELLAHTLDTAYATVARQAYLTLFERDAHRLIHENASADDLAAHYLTNLNELFGDAVQVSDEFRWEWLSIPHIYNSPFYTYAYSFGQLLVLALYQRYQAEGEAFVPRYLRILAHGGSAAPAQILTEAGLDIASPAFWQGGFDVIAGLVDDLEALSQ